VGLLRTTGHSKSKVGRTVDVRGLLDHLKAHSDATYDSGNHFLNHDPLSQLFSKAGIAYSKRIGYDALKRWWVYIDEGNDAFEQELQELTNSQSVCPADALELERVVQHGLRVQVERADGSWVNATVADVSTNTTAEVARDTSAASTSQRVSIVSDRRCSVDYGDGLLPEKQVGLERLRVHPTVCWDELASLADPSLPVAAPAAFPREVSFADSDGDTSCLKYDPETSSVQWWGTAFRISTPHQSCYVARVKQLVWATNGDTHLLYSFLDSRGRQVPRAALTLGSAGVAAAVAKEAAAAAAEAAAVAVAAASDAAAAAAAAAATTTTTATTAAKEEEDKLAAEAAAATEAVAAAAELAEATAEGAAARNN
jgi:hypothetical protein